MPDSTENELDVCKFEGKLRHKLISIRSLQPRLRKLTTKPPRRSEKPFEARLFRVHAMMENKEKELHLLSSVAFPFGDNK